MPSPSYRILDPEKIIQTQSRLQQRIAKRFPDSGLSQVALDLLAVAQDAALRAERIRKPNIPLRLAVALLFATAIVVVATLARSLQVRGDLGEVLTLVQFVEAGLGTLVFFGVAAIFLVTLEIRLKRQRALKAIHELRSLAHVVDMHQLAKDPEGLRHRGPVATAAAPATTRTLFELNRYLNYCGEMLAITSKIAAIYVQGLPDSGVVAAVDQIETLCSGLSHKIWQKIMVLEEILDDGGAGLAQPG